MTTAIQEYSKTDAALAELGNRYKGMVYDVATTKGMQDAKAARAELRGFRVDLEKVRVEIKAPALERCRLIDAEAKRITTALVDLEEPIDEQIKLEEKRKEREAMEKAMAEQRRVDGIKIQLEALRQIPASCVGKNSAQIAAVLVGVQARTTDSLWADSFAEFRTEAEDTMRSVLAQVASMQAGAQAQEAEAERIKGERAELAKLRAEQEARDRASREAMEIEQREARAQIEAEQKAAREVRAAEDARLAAERAKVDAERRAQEQARREIERKEGELLDARAMLDRFVTRFGQLPEFKAVVDAISALKGPKRKAA